MVFTPVKMDPLKDGPVVREVYHHGIVIGDVDPHLPRVSKPFLLPATTIKVAPGMKLMGFTKGHTSYEWTEEVPK